MPNTYADRPSIRANDAGHREQLAYSAFALSESYNAMASDPTPYARQGRENCRQHIIRIANTIEHAARADAGVSPL